VNCINCGKEVITIGAIRCWWCNHSHRAATAKTSMAVRYAEVCELKASGMLMVDIARKLGISRQRLYQIVGKGKQ